MQLQLRTFSSLVTSASAAVQGAADQLVDLTVGSTLRAVLEANASIGLWLQWLILEVLQMTRASTSSAGDLDSWVGDFSLARLPAISANGTVTFSRFAAVSSALIPIGTTVRTADGSQSFLVYADGGNTAYDAAQGGYLLPAGAPSLTVPAAATTPGIGGNVQTGTVSLIVAALPGIDTVNNATPFMGGLDAESDTALRARFQNFLGSRTRATTSAVAYAIASIQQGLSFTIQENVAPDGSARAGCFVVTIDDGSGSPSAGLIASISNAIEAIRPIGSTFMVRPVSVMIVTIAMSIVVVPGADPAAVAAVVADTVLRYVDQLTIGAPLPWSRLAQVAYQASPQVANVTGVLLNGGTADVVPPASGVVKAAPVMVY
jgi:phage-related baseplate assembly protein